MRSFWGLDRTDTEELQATCVVSRAYLNQAGVVVAFK